ncbi:site-2 protease family protein [Candidatus Kryptonium thompsonii]|uniref:site-2 protease family protein n=1 Tax=Candidatus Kryptonium thompsonii TaxID=1633631 RepID=UPI0007075F4C|nr:site-2 protease family protein [Candidatus Kryptonium thompsoni]CUS77365.1 Peptidase family M50 [Candidatus Kryptonium thompsoni]
MEIIKTIFYFAITIGILVLVHEFGHFIAAKLSKMKVEVFFHRIWDKVNWKENW